jgi:hypothetical protein
MREMSAPSACPSVAGDRPMFIRSKAGDGGELRSMNWVCNKGIEF